MSLPSYLRASVRAFPGLIFNENAASADPAVSDMTQQQLDACPYRSMVAHEGNDVAPIAWCWLLNEDATFAMIPLGIRIEAVEMLLAGKAVMLVCRRAKPEREVRQGLLVAVQLAAERRMIPSALAGVGHA